MACQDRRRRESTSGELVTRDASIASLRQIPTPSDLPAASRIAPQELTVYGLRALVRKVLPESDGDWHLVLADPEHGAETLVAEILDSSCALGTGHEGHYAAARRSLRSILREH